MHEKNGCINILNLVKIRLNFYATNQDISLVRGVHLQGIQRRSCSRLLQAFDNEANGRLGRARRVNIFEKLK